MLLLNKTLLRMVKGLWGRIALITFLKLVTLVGTAEFAQIISGFLGNIASPALSASNAGSAVLTAFITAAAIFLAELLTGEAEYRCTAKARQSLRAGIFSKVLELDVGSVEKIGPVSAITSSVDGVESMQIYYSKYLPGLFYCLIAPIYLFFRLKDVSLIPAAVMFVISFILLPVNNIFRSHIEKLKTEYWDSLEDLTGYYLESVRGLTAFKLFGRDKDRAAVLAKKSQAFNRKIMDVMKVNFSSFLLTDGLIYGAVAASAVIAAVQIVSGTLDFSGGLMVLLLSFGFFGSVRQLMNATHSALAGVSAADKVEKLLSIDTSRPYHPDMAVEKEPFDGIRMENISFSYPGRGGTLHNISLDIPKGKTVALAGLSGSGKSTIANLLTRFWDVKSGEVLVRGRNVKDVKLADLMDHISMVFQRVYLFQDTVYNNISMGRPDAAYEEVIEAAKKARCYEFIMALPDGFETVIGEGGASLSGGEKQRISIARCILKDAPIVILDEATASVDADNESYIQQAISELCRGKTLLVIAHRLNTIQNADKILVIADGSIVEQGTHDELIVQDGMYKNFVTVRRKSRGWNRRKIV